jgi:hypothetical protein
LIVDDGVRGRGHRTNMFNPAWRVHGCFTGPHQVYGVMTCQNFAGGVAALGSPDPLQAIMKAFMNEPVEFTAADGAPAQSYGCSDQMCVSVSGNIATKKVTRTFNMPDGSELTL